MMTLIYRGIVALLLLLVVWNILDEKDIKQQALSALVIIPLVLRVLMIK